MKLTYSLTEPDIRALIKKANLKQRNILDIIIHILVWIPLFCITIIFFKTPNDYELSKYITILFLSSFCLVIILQINQSIKKKTPLLSPAYSGFIEMTIDESGIYEKSSLSNTFASWQGVTLIEQDQLYIFIWLGNVRGYILSKDSIKDVTVVILWEEINRLYELNKKQGKNVA